MTYLELLTQPATYISLFTLAILEIILGIDNLVFISILAGKLPKQQQPKARRLGLLLALVTRVLLLLFIGAIVQMTQPVMTVASHAISVRDLVILAGGIFLLLKATKEIHHSLEEESGTETEHLKHKPAQFTAIVLQIGLIDIIFSLDSVITAAGMVQQVSIMVAAVIIAMGVMVLFVDKISNFIDKHPSIKMLALSFLIMIGCLLVAEAFHQVIPKGYVYFSMAFSLAVEALNIRHRSKVKPIQLRKPIH